MKVLLVNATEKGGAAVVAHRLLNALNVQEGVQATMLSAPTLSSIINHQSSIINHTSSFLKKALDRLPVWAANGFSRKNLWLTDGGFCGTDITKTKAFQEADVIHLHWVNQGFLSLKDIEKVLNSGKRIVWTLHDMWPLTAICHHAGDCEKYKTTGCHHCEQLRFPCRNDLATRVWRRKLEYYKAADIHFIACSSWMADKARQSILTRHLPVDVIPNAIEIAPIDNRLSTIDNRLSTIDNRQPTVDNRQPATGNRQPTTGNRNPKQICFSAARIDDSIKGFDDLLAALHYLKHREDVELVLVGNINDRSLLNKIPVPYRHLGYRKDAQNVYAEARCVVNCSRYETLPTTIVEAQSTGTTPVAYRHSGATDLISDGETGYFAEYRNPESLAKAIDQAIDHPIAPDKLRRHVKESYSPDTIAKRHIEIYRA